MHKLLLNQARLELDLSPRAGFLVKAGQKGSNLLFPGRVDMMALRTRARPPEGPTGAVEETVFIPGSTLKGVFRTTGEQALRSLDERWACDPHDHNGRCHTGPGRDADSASVHRALCLACRTFGSQQLGGRLSFTDALPTDARAWRQANETATRSGVSIDRRTGGPASGKLYEQEVVTSGTFRALVVLENYQLWQLGLLALLVDDLDAGALRVGSGRSRGLGAFTAAIRSLSLWQVPRAERVAGVGRLRPDLAGAYGWTSDGELEVALKLGQRRGGPCWEGEGDAAKAALNAVVEAAWPPKVLARGAA